MSVTHTFTFHLPKRDSCFPLSPLQPRCGEEAASRRAALAARPAAAMTTKSSSRSRRGRRRGGSRSTWESGKDGRTSGHRRARNRRTLSSSTKLEFFGAVTTSDLTARNSSHYCGGQSRKSLSRRRSSSSVLPSAAQRCAERGGPRRRVAPPAQETAAALQRHDLRPHGGRQRLRLLRLRGVRWVGGEAVEEGERRSGPVDAGQRGAAGGERNTLLPSHSVPSAHVPLLFVRVQNDVSVSHYSKDRPLLADIVQHYTIVHVLNGLKA